MTRAPHDNAPAHADVAEDRQSTTTGSGASGGLDTVDPASVRGVPGPIGRPGGVRRTQAPTSASVPTGPLGPGPGARDAVAALETLAALEALPEAGVDGGHPGPSPLDDEEADPSVTLAARSTIGFDLAPRQLEALAQGFGDALHTVDGRPLGALVAEYARQPGAGHGDDLDGFLSWLLLQEAIDKRTFLDAHARSDIELTASLPEAGAASDFELLGHLDEGGVGEIQVARDHRLRRKVALKRLKNPGKASAQTLRRFVPEAQVTAQLDHPNIVPIYTIEGGADDDLASVGFAMKLIHGQTLAAILAEDRERAGADRRGEAERRDRRLEIFIKVCDAMAYAHSRGVIHRDLKPANIMVGKYGEVYVMDWGVARVVGAARIAPEQRAPDESLQPGPVDKTRAGQIVGTPYYMSPEQACARNDQLDARSDVYALGLILHEVCTLRRAIPGERWLDVVMAASGGETQPFEHDAGRAVRLPAELGAIVARATATRRVERYDGAAELAAEVRRHLRGDEVQARPDNVPRRLLRAMARHRLATALVVLAVVTLSAAASMWFLVRQKEAVEAQKASVEQARLREERLTGWQTEIAAHGALIDRNFLRIEGLVLRLARQVGFWLDRPPTPGDDTIYSQDDFAAPSVAVPGYVESPHYHKAVSVEHPVYKLAPGVALTPDIEDKLRRLAPLRHTYRQIFLDSRTDAAVVDPRTARQLLTVDGVPLVWAYFGMAEGVMYSYPGKVGYPPEYDPRLRPWYRLGEGSQEISWGNPYIDLQGQGLILPVVTSVYDDARRFLGVVGLELTFDEIIASFLSRRDARGVVETYLLDEQGRVVVRASQYEAQYAGGRMHDALELEPLPAPAVLAEVAEQRSGQMETELEGRRLLVGYQRLPTVGWYYVEAVDPGVVLGQ